MERIVATCAVNTIPGAMVNVRICQHTKVIDS